MYISTFLLLDLNHASLSQFSVVVVEQLECYPDPWLPYFGLVLNLSDFVAGSYASNVALVESVVVI